MIEKGNNKITLLYQEHTMMKISVILRAIPQTWNMWNQSFCLEMLADCYKTPH